MTALNEAPRFRQTLLECLTEAALDGVPLAIELLAYAAEGEPDLAALAERWNQERAS